MVDIGQVEGAIVMGLGYWLTEEIKYDGKNGANGYHSTWKYKPPMAKDIPIDMRVKLLHNAPNPVGVMRSKRTSAQNLCLLFNGCNHIGNSECTVVVAEPPLNMTCSVVFAMREAINAAKVERDGEGAKKVYQLGKSSLMANAVV